MEPDGELLRIPIGTDRFAVVCRFNGNILLHIRHYKFSKESNKFYPTKIGANLTVRRFAHLMTNLGEITKTFDQIRSSDNNIVSFSLHVGGGIFCTLKTGVPGVDIRRYFVPQGETKVHPTKNGIALKYYEWTKFVNSLDEIKNSNPSLMNARHCFERGYHYNHEGAMTCTECNPFQKQYFDSFIL